MNASEGERAISRHIFAFSRMLEKMMALRLTKEEKACVEEYFFAIMTGCEAKRPPPGKFSGLASRQGYHLRNVFKDAVSRFSRGEWAYGEMVVMSKAYDVWDKGLVKDDKQIRHPQHTIVCKEAHIAAMKNGIDPEGRAIYTIK